MTEMEGSLGKLRLWFCAVAMLCAVAMALPASAAAWANEDAMRNDTNEANRDTFIYDPGLGKFISRGEFVSSLKGYYVGKGFDANFLNWAQEDKLDLGSALWAGCHVGKHTGPCPSAIEFGPVDGDVETGVVTVLHSKASAGFIATVCGNYSKASGTATPPKVTGVKYEDLNANGKRDSGDPGLGGWTIRLRQGGKVVDTTTTASNGSYSFTLDANKLDISAGAFQVEEVLKEDWFASETPSSFNVPFGAEDKTFSGKDFGNYRLAEIAGHKYDDSNVNGERDGEEVGLAKWTIPLSNGEEKTTDSEGGYAFSVRPGTYTVSEQLQEGWRQTDPGGKGAHSYTVISGQVVDDADFGNVCLGSVSVSPVDDDTGKPVPMETRLEEVSVPGILNNEPSLPRTVTDALPEFDELLPGEYRVVSFLPEGVFTTDPDVQPVEGRFAIVKEVTVLECEETDVPLHLVLRSTPGKVTGGIKIERPDGFATGGFVFMTEPREPRGPRGMLQFNDHVPDELILHTRIIEAIVVEGDVAHIWGKVEFDGALERFHLILEDAGEPGVNDRFELTLANGYEAGQGETLIGGNVQIHPTHT
jgi:SdrD B-like domain